MKKLNEMSFPEKLAHTRSYFPITRFCFVPAKTGKSAQGKNSSRQKNQDNKEFYIYTDKDGENYNIYINDPKYHGNIDTLLIPQLDAYEDTLNSLMESEESSIQIQTYIENEMREVDKLIRKYANRNIIDIRDSLAEQRIPGYLMNNIDGNTNLAAFNYKVSLFSSEAIASIGLQMTARLMYLFELKELLQKNLDEVRSYISRKTEYKPVFTTSPSIKIAELWYALEYAYFSKIYSSMELKRIRLEFYKFFGLDDKRYAHSIGDIKNRKRGQRASFLNELASIIEEINRHSSKVVKDK